jgi:hypothetical protein
MAVNMQARVNVWEVQSRSQCLHELLSTRPPDRSLRHGTFPSGAANKRGLHGAGVQVQALHVAYFPHLKNKKSVSPHINF